MDPFPYPDSPSENDIPQETPHAVDAECAVLGALLMNNDLFSELSTVLKEEHFYDKRHRLIYHYLYELCDKSHADPLLLVRRLRDSSKLADAGGEAYIADIADIGAAPVNTRAYADLIVDKAFIRSMISAHSDSLSQAFHPDGKTPAKLLDAAEGRLSQVSDLFRRHEGGMSPISEIARVYEQKIFDNRKDMSALRGIHPGFEKLFRKTHGLHGGDLIILAGRPGAGKTAFGLNLLRNVAKQENTAVLCFSLEMSAEQLVVRMLAHHGLDMHKMRSADSISSSTLSQLAAATSDLEKLYIHIDDSATLNILEARTRARRVKREMEKQGIRLGLIMVDYLQLMDAPAGGNRYDTRALEVSVISRGLKALAKELNTPIIALSQLNRGAEKRADTRPVMSDLRESGAIEQDADLILFLHSKNDSAPNQNSRINVKLIIGKQRSGPIGDIDFEFDKPLSSFKEADISNPPDSDGY